jgi:hypothetical protein
MARLAVIGLVTQKVTKLEPAHLRLYALRSQGGIWEGTAVACLDESRPRSWQHLVWMLMTTAGVLLLVCAALSL